MCEWSHTMAMWNKEDQLVVEVFDGLEDGSYKSNENYIGRVLLLLTYRAMKRISTLYWKSRKIYKVAYSFKDAEKLNI